MPCNTTALQSKIVGRFGIGGARSHWRTKLVDLRNRVYAPHLKGFLSRDPMGNVDSQGLYTYVAADPIDLRDPWGLKSNEKPAEPKHQGQRCVRQVAQQCVEWVDVGPNETYQAAKRDPPPPNPSEAEKSPEVIFSALFGPSAPPPPPTDSDSNLPSVEEVFNDAVEAVGGFLGGIVSAVTGAAQFAATHAGPAGALMTMAEAGSQAFTDFADVSNHGFAGAVSQRVNNAIDSAQATAHAMVRSPAMIGSLTATAVLGIATGAGGLRVVGRGVFSRIARARTFASGDPLVGELANAIERAYPGHVVGVNVPLRTAAGTLVTDADILLKNAVIQVKSGGGKRLTTQLARTESVTSLPVIGYGPDLKPHVVRGIQSAGGLATRDEKLLIDVVAP